MNCFEHFVLDLCNSFAAHICENEVNVLSLTVSGHNQTLFFLYSPFVNVNLETTIISVGKIFTEL